MKRSSLMFPIPSHPRLFAALHFIAANLIVLFVFVHVAMVLLAGPVNELRSMITRRFVIFPGAIMSSIRLPRRRFLALGAASGALQLI